MYLQPYGDEQQLNLNWIINEIINLHKQLDPDYETPSFTQVYPYSNLNRLNLDWVLSELKALKELAPEPTPELDIQAVAEALVALPFDSNTSYQIYDFISRDGEIWRATEAIAAGGEWDETKWFKTKIGTDLAVLERWINTINNSLTSLQNTVADLSSADISDDSDAGGATVKASLNLLKGSLNSFRPNQLKRRWIFIGDSYGHASGSNNGWIDKLVPMLGLSASDYYESAVGGYSFSWEGSQFITLLQNLAATITDKNAITDIVVLGGANDAGQSAVAISAAIEAFNTYAYTTFPNCVVRIGMVGGNGDYTKVVSQYSRVKEGYANCGKAQYLNNLEYVFQNRNLIGSDNIHPTAEGYTILANKIFDALNGGCSVIYREFGRPVAPNGYSNITNANFYNVFVNNGVTQIAVANRAGKVTTDSAKYFPVQANKAIELVTLPTKIFLPPAIGSENGFVCPCFARVMSATNNTSYQIKGYAVLAGANRTLYFIPNDIILGTTSAFNSCSQIEIDAASFTCASICC